MRALRGELDTDAGSVSRPKRTGYLGQERLADDLLAGASAGAPVAVREAMLAGRDLAAIAAELRAIEAQLAQVSPGEAQVPAVATTSPPARKPAPANPLDALLARHGELGERFSRAGRHAPQHENRHVVQGLGLGDVEL